MYLGILLSCIGTVSSRYNHSYRETRRYFYIYIQHFVLIMYNKTHSELFKTHRNNNMDNIQVTNPAPRACMFKSHVVKLSTAPGSQHNQSICIMFSRALYD